MSVFKLSLGPGDDYCEFGMLTVNGAGPWQLDNWGDEPVHLKGKWVAGHSLGKSTRDSYFIDNTGSERFFLTDFTPQYGLDLGATGKGRWLYSPYRVYESDTIWFLVQNKDGKQYKPF